MAQTASPKHPRASHFGKSPLFDGLTTFSELEARITALPQKDRGAAFEVFAEAYLATQKQRQATDFLGHLAELGVVLNLGCQ